jgi:VWFA-related protein
MMIKTLQEADRMARDQQSRPTLAGLLALAQQQGALPGRKSIVYFCEGLPLTAGTKDALHSLVAAANRSSVSIYPVDVSGLSMDTRSEAGREMLAAASQASRDARALPVNMSISSTGRGAPAGISPSGPPTPADPNANRIRAMDRAMDAIVSDAQASLIDLGESTGGFYIGNSNDVRKPARKLIEDVATYYEASYTPEATAYDGRFHPIVVKVNRKSARVQARNGYLAVPPGTPTDIQPFEAGLLKHLAARELPRQLDFRAEVVPFGREGDRVSASLVVEVPLRQMEFREDGNAFELHPMMLALLKNQQGEVVRKFSENLPYRGALEAKERMRDGAYTMQKNFTAAPGAFVLEVAIADGLNDKAGAQRNAVTIPDMPAGLGLSGISLVRRADAISEEAAATELFRYRNTKVVPNLERTVSREQSPSVSAFFVLYPDEKLKETPKLELELSRRGKSLGRFPMELPADSKGAVPFVASIPSASLRPGPYELAAIVTQAGKELKQQTTFRVEGTEPMPVAEAEAPPKGSGQSGAHGLDEDASLPENAEPASVGALTISRIDNAGRPDAAEQKLVLETARTHAVEYESSLPNFICIQITRRWQSRGGQNKWQAKDSLTEMLRFLEGKEVRRTLEVNGVKAHTERAGLHGVLSSGEFGGLLRAVFDEKAKATFEWKELASMGNQTCHVYSFRVEARNSDYAVIAGAYNNERRVVGFHGLVYIDAARYLVRRISLEADGLPPTFPVQQSAIWVNYDMVQIADHEHMLPVAAEVLVRMGKHTTVKNEMTFRDYRRFGAESSIQFASE